MSESPVVEMTALDAKALRELVEGLMAEVRALKAEVEDLKATPRITISPTPTPSWPWLYPGEITSAEATGCACGPYTVCANAACPRRFQVACSAIARDGQATTGGLSN